MLPFREEEYEYITTTFLSLVLFLLFYFSVVLSYTYVQLDVEALAERTRYIVFLRYITFGNMTAVIICPCSFYCALLLQEKGGNVLCWKFT